jgi:hypothetical protein
VATIDTLVADVFELLGGDKLNDIPIGLFEKFGKEMELVLRSRLTPEERVPALRMSNVGRPLRQLWYELNGYKGETISGQTQFKFLYGHVLEALCIALAESAGHEVSRFQEEVEVDGIKGHIDCVVDGVLVDVKSCSPYSFKKFEDGSLLQPGSDPFGYVGQLSGYANQIGLPAAWIAINKVTGDICILRLPNEYIENYDIRKRIETVRAAVNLPDEPERCYEPVPVSKTDKSGNMVLPVGCSYCGWKEYCWRDANEGRGLKTYIYSTGPKFFTKILKEPRVFEANNYKKEEQ